MELKLDADADGVEAAVSGPSGCFLFSAGELLTASLPLHFGGVKGVLGKG